MDIRGNREQERVLDSLQKWFEENKNLPSKIDRIVLTRFYYCMQRDIEKTKQVLKTSYAIRQNNPNFFIKRDPTDQDTANTIAYADMVYLPGLTADNYRISILRIKDPDPKLMHYARDFKAYIMVADHRFALPDVVKDKTKLISAGDIQIIDLNNFTMAHLTYTSLGVFRTYMKYLHQGYPVNVKGLHVINCPKFLNKILAVVKPFISKDIYEKMYFHTAGLETLYQYVPREMLPKEYGGNNSTMSQLMQESTNSLYHRRDYITNLKYWKTE